MSTDTTTAPVRKARKGLTRGQSVLVVIAIVAILVGSYAAFAYATRRPNLQGTVVVAAATTGGTAHPVANATVQLWQTKYGIIATLRTDEQGHFVGRVEPGTYYIKVSACAQIPHRWVTVSLGLVETRNVVCAPGLN